MSTDKLLAPVGTGEQFPGGCYDFGGSTNGAYMQAAYDTDPTNIPDLGTGNFDLYAHVRSGQAATQYILCWYKDASNYAALYRTSTSWKFLWKVAGTNRVDLTLTHWYLSAHSTLLVTRRGNTFTLSQVEGLQRSTFDAATSVISDSMDITGGDTFSSSIRVAGSKLFLGHFDGSTVAQKWNGAIGLVAVVQGSLDTYTDAEKFLLLQDPQRYFSHHEYATNQFTAFGNWVNSSDVAYDVTKRTNLTNGDKSACPFSGRELTIVTTATTTNEYGHPAYTMPTQSYPVTLWHGSYNWLDKPEAIENPQGGWLTYAVTPDSAGNPHWFLVFLNSSGTPDRWPVPIPFVYYYVDASASNAKGTSYFSVAGASSIVEPHNACAMLWTKAGVLISPYVHSTARQNTPDTGDWSFEYEQLCLMTDDGPQHIETYTAAPWGTAYSSQQGYLRGLATYSLMTRRGNTVLCESRSGSSTGAYIIIREFNEDTLAVRRYSVISSDATLRNYPANIVNMSDGRSIAFFRYLEGNSVSNIGYSAVIVPPAAGMDSNTNWFAPDGTPLDGSGAVQALGSCNQLDDLELHITTDNDGTWPPPSGSSGLDWLRGFGFHHVNKDFEGVVSLIQVGDGNGANVNNTTNSSGTSNPVFDTAAIRRWTYTPGETPTLVYKDQVDITARLATWNPGLWPQDTDYNTADVQHWQTMQLGTNSMLILVFDPENVAVGTQVSYNQQYAAFTIRGVVVTNLAADDPADIVFTELLEPIYSIATDNSEGYGLLPYTVGSGGDGSKSVLIGLMGGDWTGQSIGNRLWRGVDLRNNIRGTLAANNLLARRRSWL